MSFSLTTSSEPAGPPVAWAAADWAALRAAGLAYVEQYGRANWTDYNRHDPGVTILEVLCYAITDLSYRASLPMEDLLASSFGSAAAATASLLPAHEALPSAPVTVADYRKLFIDVVGVRNAWLRPVTLPIIVDPLVIDPGKRLSYAADAQNVEEDDPVLRFELRGLYDILVEFDPAASGQHPQILAEVRAKYLAHRNLGEDCRRITEVPVQYIALCADVDLTPGALVAEVYAQMLLAIGQYLSPPIRRYSLAEMQAQRNAAGQPLAVEELYEGPYLEFGFIRDEDLAASSLRTRVYASDLINLLVRIPGVVAIRKLQLNRLQADANGHGYAYEAGGGQAWELDIPKGHQARLQPEDLAFSFYKGIVPVGNEPDFADGRKRLEALLKAAAAANAPDPATLPIPTGEVYDLAEYRPLAYDFPANYGIGPEGLPGEASPARRNQARQLKAYLVLFDQLLTNYLAQLNNLPALFGTTPAFDRFLQGQPLQAADFVGLSELFPDASPSELTDALTNAVNAALVAGISPQQLNGSEELVELAQGERDLNRLSAFFDHLLARSGEDFGEYGALMHALYGTAGTAAVVRDKARFLKGYTDAAAPRHNGQAYDYSRPGGDTAGNLAALVQRYEQLFGTKRLELANPFEEGGYVHGANVFIISVAPTPDGEFTYSLHSPFDSLDDIVLPFPGEEGVFEVYLESKPFKTRKAAQEALQRTFYRGRWAVEKVDEASDTYTHRLRDADGRTQAEYPGELFFTTRNDAQLNLDKARRLLIYWGEALYLVEHTLLRPEPVSYDFEINPADSNGLSLVSAATFATAADARQVLEQNFQKSAGVAALVWKVTEHKDVVGNKVFGFEIALGNVVIARGSQWYGSDEGAREAMNAVKSKLVQTNGPPHTVPSSPQVTYTVNKLEHDWMPVCAEPDGTFCEPLDPYSLRVSLVLPGYTTRAQSVDFRRLAEQTLRAELPAHVLARICWVGKDEMRGFETFYSNWTRAKAAVHLGGSRKQYADATNQLLRTLQKLHTIYPPGVLHDCNSPEEENPIILGRTMLGSSAASPVTKP